MGDDAAVEIDDHALAHGIEGAVRSAHADIGGDHEIAEGIGLVGEAPGLTHRGGIARRAQHDLGTLIGCLACHFREHAVVADDQGELAALRAFDDGNSEIAGFPGFDRHPGMELAVIEFDLALVVDNKTGVPRIAAGIVFHDGKAAPDAVVAAGLSEGCDFGTIHPAHDLRVRIHRQAMQGIFREDDEIHAGDVAARLGDHADDLVCLGREIGPRHRVRQLQLHEADDHALGRLVETAKSVHGSCSYLVMLSSPGAETMARVRELIAIRRPRVST